MSVVSALGFSVLLPELLLAASSLTLLVLGAYLPKRAFSALHLTAIAVLVAALLLLPGGAATGIAMNGMLQLNGYTALAKGLILSGSIFVLVLAHHWIKGLNIGRHEFSVLVLLASLGLMLTVSADNLISLYVGLELANLSIYVLAAFDRDDPRATEAGLKYFILGSLASGLYLFGASLVYGFAGGTGFDLLAQLMVDGTNSGALVGMVLVLIAFFFKISAVPFHMWTPDVYEGAPTPVTSFFAMVPKVAVLALLTRLVMEPFGPLTADWQPIMVVVAIASMAVGSFGALTQTNIKRLMAYSSIGHVGYALLGVTAASSAGVLGLLLYILVYLVMNAGVFACILLMRRKGEPVEAIDALAGLSSYRPLLALSLLILMFSMAGIPPLAGFFSKFYVFVAAAQAGFVWLAVLGVLFSVVSAFYYLRIVKLMYIDEPDQKLDTASPLPVIGVLALSILFNCAFFLYPSPWLQTVRAAAGALLGTTP